MAGDALGKMPNASCKAREEVTARDAKIGDACEPASETVGDVVGSMGTKAMPSAAATGCCVARRAWCGACARAGVPCKILGMPDVCDLVKVRDGAGKSMLPDAIAAPSPLATLVVTVFETAGFPVLLPPR